MEVEGVGRAPVVCSLSRYSACARPLLSDWQINLHPGARSRNVAQIGRILSTRVSRPIEIRFLSGRSNFDQPINWLHQRDDVSHKPPTSGRVSSRIFQLRARPIRLNCIRALKVYKGRKRELIRFYCTNGTHATGQASEPNERAQQLERPVAVASRRRDNHLLMVLSAARFRHGCSRDGCALAAAACKVGPLSRGRPGSGRA